MTCRLAELSLGSNPVPAFLPSLWGRLRLKSTAAVLCHFQTVLRRNPPSLLRVAPANRMLDHWIQPCLVLSYFPIVLSSGIPRGC